VPTSQRVPILILVTAMSFLAGCGGSTSNVQNPPPPPQQNITIAFQSPPPAGISLSQTASLTAVVNNDPSNAGVSWALTCVNQDTFGCGSLSAAQTPSGQATTFTPPSAFSGNTASVNIVAYATANTNVNVLAQMTITAFGSVLQGTYVFHVEGSDDTFAPVMPYPYQIAGAINLDGNGNVVAPAGGTSAGQETINTYNVNADLVSTAAQITGGSYFIGTDGRGTLIVNATDQSGDTIVQDFSLVVLSSSLVSIAQLGGTITNAQGSFSLTQSSTGTMALQNPNAVGTQPLAGYAFVTSGTDASGTPISYGGILNFNSQGNFTGTSSVMDAEYSGNTNFFMECIGTGSLNGTVSAPSTFGTVVITINAPNCLAQNTAQLTGYIVDSSHLVLVETDGSFFTAGISIGQGSATGTFTDASFSGPFVFGVLGIDLSDSYPSTMTSVTVVNANGNDLSPALTGVTDTYFQNLDAQISDQFTANYSVDTKLIGRVHASHFKFQHKHFPTYAPDMTFFLTGNGNPVLVLFGGPPSSYGSLGVGIAYPQASNADTLTFGNGELYGFSFTQENGSENDGSGQMTPTLTDGEPPGTQSGLVDEFNNGFQVPPYSLTGTFACPENATSCPDSFGRFANSTFVVDGVSSGVTYYMIDDNHSYMVETDLISQSSGQVALGYFAQRCNVTVANGCGQGGEKSSRRGSKKRR